MSSDPLMLEREFAVGPVRVTIWTRPPFIQGGRASETRRIAIDRAPSTGNSRDRREDTLTPTDIPKAILALKKAHDYLELANRHRLAASNTPPAEVRMPERVP
jgi:hypothetical protein